MNCPKCNEPMSPFTHMEKIETYECIDCKLVTIVLTQLDKRVNNLAVDFIDAVLDQKGDA